MTAEGTFPKSDGDILYASEVNSVMGLLGEVRMFALSISGAVTKAYLQGKGWAICDGTTPAAQGISDPTITTTPNLEHKFIRMSNDESSGGTGGEDEHNHQWYNEGGTSGDDAIATVTDSGEDYNSFDSTGAVVSLDGTNLSKDYYTAKVDTKPPYYELAFFIKVK